MPLGSDAMETSGSTRSTGAVNLEESGDVHSSEDAAWADSCLIKDPEIFGSDWTYFKDSLLETLSSSPDLQLFASSERDGFLGTNPSILPDTNFERSDDEILFSREGMENNNNENLTNERTDTNLENVFLPTYNEAQRRIESFYSEATLEFPAFVIEEPSTEEVFKVWDLEIPAEEDELIKQLNKALAASSLEALPPNSDKAVACEGLKDQSLDDLISGIADLSLNQFCG